MNSVDTQILVYALNQDCAEHLLALPILKRIVDQPRQWIIADQVLFELYRCLRNPLILKRPLNANEASKRIDFFDHEIGCIRCGWEHKLWQRTAPLLAANNFAYQRTFDATLAITLLANGVTTFYTRNAKDFEQFSFQEILNPID